MKSIGITVKFYTLKLPVISLSTGFWNYISSIRMLIVFTENIYFLPFIMTLNDHPLFFM